eukprot:scaffold21733_cov53-Attheya_sp.AAC.3
MALKVMVIPSTVPGKNTERLVRFMIKKFGLEEIAKTHLIEIKITYDGASSLRTKDTSANGEMISLQSRDNVVIACIHMMGETEENVDEAFADIYKFVNKKGQEGLPVLSSTEPAIHLI